MRALAEGFGQALAGIDSDGILALRRRLTLVAQATTLQGAMERNSDATIAALVAALINRGAAEVEARVAATAMISGLSVALLEWARSDQLSLEDALGSALTILGGA